MSTENELQKIDEVMKTMNYNEIMETLMRIELLVAEKQNKMVFPENNNVQ